MATDTIRYHEVRVYAEDGQDVSAYETYMDDNNVDYSILVYSSDAVDECKTPLLTWTYGDDQEILSSMNWPCIIYKDRRYESGDNSLDVPFIAQTVDDLPSDFLDKVETV
ncbi:MAG: hypothetical protein VW270_06470 [Candidatus Poseidoniales archaeon]